MPQPTSFRTSLASAFASLALAATALAQSHISPLTFEWGAWRFKPIYQPQGLSNRVTGIVALADTGSTVGDNIASVLYTRNQDDSWSASAWSTQELAIAVKRIKIDAGIDDSEDHLWGLDEPLTILPGITPEPSRPYDKGLFVDDPLYPIVAATPNPLEIVEVLAAVGYPAAKVELDRPPVCGVDPVLQTIATAFEWAHDQPVSDDDSAALQAEGTANRIISRLICAALCEPATTTLYGPIRQGPCVWIFHHSEIETPPTGIICSYIVRKTFSQTRLTTEILNDCSTRACRQVRFGQADSPIEQCLHIVIPGETPYHCPIEPDCTGPADTAFFCVAALNPYVWFPWGPPCP